MKEQTKLDFLLQKHFVEKKYESLKSLISEKTVTSNPNPFQISPSLQSVVYQPPPIPYQPAYQLNQPFSYIPPPQVFSKVTEPSSSLHLGPSSTSIPNWMYIPTSFDKEESKKISMTTLLKKDEKEDKDELHIITVPGFQEQYDQIDPGILRTVSNE